MRGLLDGARQEVRQALRALGASPATTAVAVLTLALGIGANVALFSVVNAVLLRPLPYAEADRLMVVGGVSLPDFEDLTQRSGSFEEAAVWASNRYDVRFGAEAEPLLGAVVSALRVKAAVAVAPAALVTVTVLAPEALVLWSQS